MPVVTTVPTLKVRAPRDGSKLTACQDMECEVLVRKGVIVPVDGNRFKVLRIDPGKVTLGWLSSRGKVDATVSLDSLYAFFPAGSFQIEIRDIGNNSAILGVCAPEHPLRRTCFPWS